MRVCSCVLLRMCGCDVGVWVGGWVWMGVGADTHEIALAKENKCTRMRGSMYAYRAVRPLPRVGVDSASSTRQWEQLSLVLLRERKRGKK
jgi:hypothetical protein